MRTHLHSYSAKRTLRLLLTVVFLFVIVAACVWVVGQIFVLKRIEVVGDNVGIQVDKDRVGQNILFLQTEKLEQELLAAYPLIGSVKFSKSLPSTLIIRVLLRTPYAVLVTGVTEYILDKDGIVLGSQKVAGNLVRLHFDTPPLSIGSRVGDARIRQSLAFLQSVGEVSIDTISSKDSAEIQATSGHTSIFLPQSGDLTRKAATLQTIVAGFRIKGTLPTVIDLRFDKPIVTY